MARWKLATAHYINCLDGAEWEYSEVDRTTGRNIRKKFPVPRLLNPLDPSDWNNKWGSRDNEEGEVIVCLEGKGEPRDYTFLGDPTPDMIPLDDEARAISADFADRWSFKPATGEPGNFSQSLVDKFQSEMADIKSKPVEIPGLTDLVSAITTSNKQNSELMAELIKRRI